MRVSLLRSISSAHRQAARRRRLPGRESRSVSRFTQQRDMQFTSTQILSEGRVLQAAVSPPTGTGDSPADLEAVSRGRVFQTCLQVGDGRGIDSKAKTRMMPQRAALHDTSKPFSCEFSGVGSSFHGRPAPTAGSAACCRPTGI